MTEIEKKFNEVVTPKEVVNQSLKRQELKGLINNGQAYKLPGKTLWTCNRIDKATDKVIEKLYTVVTPNIRRSKAQAIHDNISEAVDRKTG